jgi:hypothetical protein
MPIITEEVLIKLDADYSELDTALAALEKSGAVDPKIAASFRLTTAEIAKQAAAAKVLDASLKPTKKTIEDLVKQFKSGSTASKEFLEGMQDELDAAGVSAQEFLDALDKMDAGNQNVAASSVSVKQELRALTEQIARAKVNGQDYGEEFEAMVQHAGHLKDSLADVNQTIKTTGSDTSVFDGLISATQGIAGGFAVAQGAAALFGEEDKEVQQALLKVNAAMAILQGLQSIQNVLQKESAASLLLVNIQQKVKNAQIVLENALQSESIVVRAGATVAQKALNVAMAANPIGIVLFALAALILALKTFSTSAEDARRAMNKLNSEFDFDIANLDKYADDVKRNGAELVAALESRAAKQTDISKQNIKNTKDELQATIETAGQYKTAYDAAIKSQEDFANKRVKFDPDLSDANEKFIAGYKALLKRREDLASQARIQSAELEKTARAEELQIFSNSIDAQLARAREGSANQLKLQKQQVAAEAAIAANANPLEANKIYAEAKKRQLELDAEYNKRAADLSAKRIESELVNVKEGSAEQLKLQFELLRAQEASDVSSTKLSEAETLAIHEDYLQRRLKLQTDYNKRIVQEEIQNQISRNNAEIEVVKAGDEDKLLLQIANIELAAAAETEAANGNSSKIKEINAKRDFDIAQTRKQFIEDAAAYEIELEGATQGARNRGLLKTVDNERKSLKQRISALTELTDFEVSQVDIKIGALNKQYSQGLISTKDYNLAYAKLLDERSQTEEEEAQKAKEIRLQNLKSTLDAFLQVAEAISGVLSGLNDNQNARDENRINGLKNTLAAEKEAGAISEKDAIARQKRIDAEEKKIKLQAAKRDKDLALFNAVIATARGIAEAIPNPFLIALAAAVGAAQIALIASRPLPKFGKGKNNNNYQGMAEIGETGPELHVREDGTMQYARRRTITWVGANDKVYTPFQTMQIMGGHNVNKELMKSEKGGAPFSIDYSRIGKEVAKNSKGVNVSIHKDFIAESVADGLSRTNYFNNRYTLKYRQ